MEPVITDLQTTYENLQYTHKVHEKEAEGKSSLSVTFKIANLIVIALTLASTIADLAIHDEDRWKFAAHVATMIVAFVAVIFAAILLTFEAEKDGEIHRSSAKAFVALRDEYSRLIADAKSGIDPLIVRSRRDRLDIRKDELYKSAPQTSDRAYKKATAELAR